MNVTARVCSCMCACECVATTARKAAHDNKHWQLLSLDVSGAGWVTGNASSQRFGGERQWKLQQYQNVVCNIRDFPRHSLLRDRLIGVDGLLLSVAFLRLVSLFFPFFCCCCFAFCVDFSFLSVCLSSISMWTGS